MPDEDVELETLPEDEEEVELETLPEDELDTLPEDELDTLPDEDTFPDEEMIPEDETLPVEETLPDEVELATAPEEVDDDPLVLDVEDTTMLPLMPPPEEPEIEPVRELSMTAGRTDTDGAEQEASKVNNTRAFFIKFSNPSRFFFGAGHAADSCLDPVTFKST